MRTQNEVFLIKKEREEQKKEKKRRERELRPLQRGHSTIIWITKILKSAFSGSAMLRTSVEILIHTSPDGCAGAYSD
jgi:hypothetical protein